MTTTRAIYLTFGLIVSITLLLVSAPATSARYDPIYEVIEKPIPLGSGRELSMEQVGNVLMGAAQYKRWSVAKVEEGHLRAEINVRQHFAAIDIRYTQQVYSITYRDSRVLNHDGSKIHRNYNKWIKLIEKEADAKFASE
jgi:hypothetical protein